MDEYVIKQKIQNAFFEPRAPEGLIDQVILRSHAVAMGVEAQKQLAQAPAEQVSELASCALVGQLAAVSELPKGIQPEKLAQQLEQAPAFRAALRGGNVAGRLHSGEFLRQMTDPASQPEQQLAAPDKEAQKLPGMG